MIRHSSTRWPYSKKSVETRRYPNAASDVCAETRRRTLQADESTFSARAPSRTKISVLRIPCVSNDVVDSLPTHQSMWHTSLAVKYSTKGSELADHLAFICAYPMIVLLTLKSANPTNISHGCFDIFDVKLIFQADWNTV